VSVIPSKAVEAAARALHDLMWGETGEGKEAAWLAMRARLHTQARAALAAAAPHMGPQWQTIDSAPKDGTLVLLGREDDPDWPLRCRRWSNGHWRGHDADDATHWQPLPAQPTAREGDDA